MYLRAEERVARGKAARGEANELDYELFVAAVKSGRLTAQAGL